MVHFDFGKKRATYTVRSVRVPRSRLENFNEMVITFQKVWFHFEAQTVDCIHFYQCVISSLEMLVLVCCMYLKGYTARGNFVKKLWCFIGGEYQLG